MTEQTPAAPDTLGASPEPLSIASKPPPPTGATNDAARSAAKLARLRAEISAQTDKQTQALLLHECASLEEGRGEEPAAARDYLAAFNADPQFREPLESLVRILSRRKSVKNLGKLLDALTRAAQSPDEKARALHERATYVDAHEQNTALAKELIEEAITLQPEDPLLWLELELIAAKTGDAAGRMRALEARAELAHDPTWKALLFLALAEVASKAGDTARAYELIGSASALEGKARFRTQLLLEQIATADQNVEAIGRALEGQADLIEEALDDGARGDNNGVPRYLRRAEHAADCWLRAAELKRRAGDLGGCTALLDRAAERLPDSSLIARARLVLLEALGDAAGAAEIAKRELDRGVSGWSAAALWMRLAEAAALASDRAGALAALRKALESDKGSIPARALEIDLLGDGQEPVGLAASLEALADCLHTDEAKARAYALAAYVYGVAAGDSASAKAALAQAGACGLSQAIGARIARMIAALRNDAPWLEEATKRLIATAAIEPALTGHADATEVPSLWLELGRSKLLRGDDAGAGEAFAKLAACEDEASPTTWLGRALGAYALGLRAPADGAAAVRSPDPIEALARSERDPEVARGLSLVAALRAARQGDVARARTRLTELHHGQAGDEITAIFLAELERRAGDLGAAASALSACAAASDDRELSAALHLEAAMLLWRGGERVENGKARAIESLEAARAQMPRAGATMLAWAIRGADAETIEGRRRALDAAVDAEWDEALIALERFGLEIAAGDGDDALQALEAVERTANGDLNTAGALARILWPAALEHKGEVDRALGDLEDLGGEARAIARAERFRLARSVDQDRALAVARARTWYDADRKLYTALEWMGASIAAEDRDSESSSLRAASEHFTGEPQAALLAHASVVAMLDQPTVTHPLVQNDRAPAQLVNLELAPPGCDPRRRAAALQGIGNALGDDAQLDAMSMSGWSQLAGSDPEGARKSFRTVLELRPKDIACWEGVRAASTTLGDHVSAALACAQLGALCVSAERGAERWEEAGLILLQHTDAAEDAEIAFERAFDRSARRAVAFDKLFRAVRGRNEDDKLLDVIERRLEVSEDDREIGKLYWERARVLRKKGDLDGALAALENVTMLEADHVGALALLGEICITKGAFEEAAPFLARLAQIPEAPKQQRLMSGIAAVDLYENKLQQPQKALDVLAGLHKDGLSNLSVRERMAKVAARAGAWVEATSILETLMVERTTREGRMEAARLSLAIWRHNLNEPARGQAAVAKLLEESTDDAEGVDFVLVTPLEAGFTTRVLARAKAAVLAALASTPNDHVRIDLLARIASKENDLGLRQATLGALIAVGKGGAKVTTELQSLDGRVAARPQISLDDHALAEIADPEDMGPLTELFAQIAETVALALGPSLSSLGVTKKEKVDARGGNPLRMAVAEWVGAVGINTDWDLYVGGPDPRAAHGIAGETPAIVIGSGIKAPFDASARSAVAREVFALRRGITSLRTRDDNTIASIVAACAIEAGLSVPPPQLAVYGEVSRAVKKEIPRRVKKAIPEICQRIYASRLDPAAWARSARRSLDRMAAIAAADVSIVLSDGKIAVDDDRGRRLLAFVLSPSYLDLRKKLGMGVK
jgi:tetratricopeptide (TPR) repeat protein